MDAKATIYTFTPPAPVRSPRTDLWATVLDLSPDTPEKIRRARMSYLKGLREPVTFADNARVPSCASNVPHAVFDFMEYCDLRGLAYDRMSYDKYREENFAPADRGAVPLFDAVERDLNVALEVCKEAREPQGEVFRFDLPDFPVQDGYTGSQQQLLVDDPQHPLANRLFGLAAKYNPQASLFLVVEALDHQVYWACANSPKLAASTFGDPEGVPDALLREPACFCFDTERERALFAEELAALMPGMRMHMREREDHRLVGLIN